MVLRGDESEKKAEHPQRDSNPCYRRERAGSWAARPLDDGGPGPTVTTLHPQRDSNPCYRRERAGSWAARRWGPVLANSTWQAGSARAR